MTGTESILNNIKNEIGGKTTVRYICCGECHGGTTYDLANPLPTTCPTCKANDPKWGVGMSFSEARNNLKTSPAPQPAQAPAIAPAQEPKTAKPVAQAPEPKPEQKPEPKQTKARVSKPKPEPKAAEPTVDPAVSAPVNDAIDLKAQRLAAIDKLISIHGLNTVQFIKVGTAEVYSVGFTSWDGNLPSYTFQEPFDTAESFRSVLKEARAQDGRIAVDVALMTNIEPQELVNALFQGQLVAGLASDTGPIRVKAGDKVKIGARVTKTGGLLFRVLKVMK